MVGFMCVPSLPSKAHMQRLPSQGGPILDWLRDLRSADAIFVSDSRQRVVVWSAEAERLLGRPAAEVVGRPCYEVMAGTELDGHPVCRRNCRVATNAKRGRPTVAYDIVARTADGEPICLTSSIILATSQDRARPYMLHLVRPRSRPPDGTAISGATTPFGAVERSAVPPIGQPLSRRELEVLRLLAAGQTTVGIAEALTISRITARNHIQNLERKLGAHSRVEAVIYGSHHQLI